jgi:hypothetical protein
MGDETSRLRDQFQQVGDRVEGRLEGWLEEPPWEGFLDERDSGRPPDERPIPADPAQGPAWDPLEDWEEDDPGEDPAPEPWQDRWSADSQLDEDLSEGADQTLEARSRRPPARRAPERSSSDRYRGRPDDDPWI